MRDRFWVLVLMIAVWTALTLAGSIYAVFRIAITLAGNPMFFETLTITLLFFLILMVVAGGGLWGHGLGRLLHSNVTALTRTGAVIWGSTAIIGFAALGLSQTPILALVRATSLDLHTLFTVEFALAVGLVTAINAWVMVGKMGLTALRLIGARNVGVAAALGNLTMNLVLWFGLGWQVGQPVPGTHSMVTITNLCNLAAALAGGLALGWTIVRRPESVPMTGAVK